MNIRYYVLKRKLTKENKILKNLEMLYNHNIISEEKYHKILCKYLPIVMDDAIEFAIVKDAKIIKKQN